MIEQKYFEWEEHKQVILWPNYRLDFPIEKH